MFLHIFLMPDSLILLKYWAPLMRMQEMRWPRPGDGKEKNQHTTLFQNAKKQQGANDGTWALTFKDVLELVLLQGGAHHLLDGRHVLVEFDHQGVVVHALHVGHDGVVTLFG